MASRWAARLALGVVLALGVLPAARAQTAPALEGERRIFSFEDALTLDQLEHLSAAIAAVESQSGQRFFIIVSREPSVLLARATVVDWKRRAAEDPNAAWRPDSSLLVVATPGMEDAAVEFPAELRDKYGLSPFAVRDQLVGPNFSGAARRGDLAAALEKLLEAIVKWLAEADTAFNNSAGAIDDGPLSDEVDVTVLGERLSNLETRTLWLSAEGADMKSVEGILVAARVALRGVFAARKKGDVAFKAARNSREAIEAASHDVDKAEVDRARLLEDCRRVRDAIEQARREATGPSPDLDAAQAAWSRATRERMRRPLVAGRHLAEAEAALVRARPVETPPPPPPPPLVAPITWKRIAAALVALVVVFATGFVSVARAARAEARAAYHARADEVARDARELREVFVGSPGTELEFAL